VLANPEYYTHSGAAMTVRTTFNRWNVMSRNGGR